MSNLSLIALGLAEVREGSEITAGGVARMAEGIIQSWRSPIRWSYGKGDNEVSDISCIGDMFKERRHPDGSVDSKFLPAMYRAVAECFLPSDDEFTSADKMQFKRAWQIAAGHFSGVEVAFVDADIIRNGKRAKVRAVEVPAAVAFDLYAEDGTTPTAAGKVLEADVKRSLKRAKKKADETAVRQMAEETPIECVGGKIDGVPVPSVSVISDRLAAYAINAGLMPAKSSRASRVPAQKFVDSVEYLTKCLNDIITTDQSDFAPSEELDNKLRALAYAIDKYVN